jgi:hypothetical protein
MNPNQPNVPTGSEDLRQSIVSLAIGRGCHRQELKALAAVLADVQTVPQLKFLRKVAIKRFAEPIAVSSLTTMFRHLARLFQVNPGVNPEDLVAVHYIKHYAMTHWGCEPHIHEVREQAAHHFRQFQTFLNERKGLPDAKALAMVTTAIPFDAPALPHRTPQEKPEIDPINYRRLQKWLLEQKDSNQDHREILHLKTSIQWTTGWRGETVRKLLDSDIQELGNGQIRISPTRSMNKACKRDGPCEHFENPARILAWRDEVRRRRISKEGLLFPVLTGPSAGLEDSAPNMSNTYRRAGKDAGCTVTVTPHTFRRAHGTAIGTAPHGQLSDATRAHVWENIEMTKIYDRTGNRHIVDSYLHIFAAEGMPIEGVNRCSECHGLLEGSQQRCDTCGRKTSVEGFQAAAVDPGDAQGQYAAFGVEAANAVQPHLRSPYDS